jgi:peptidoglycan glycosyltransferase
VGCLLAIACLIGWNATAHADGPKVDMRNARVTASNVTAPTDRGSAVLTLDPNLQRDVDQLLGQARPVEGAIVVIDVRTGRILAWSSVDPAGRDLVSTPYAPPASLFKVVTATALIEDAGVPASATQCYVGGQRSARLSNLRSSGAGGARCDTFETALGYSRNMVIAGLAVRHLDGGALRAWSRSLGMTSELPIDTDIQPGTFAVPATKDEIARAAAGFGDGKISVLGAAYMMSIIANGGVRPRLSLIDYIEGANGERMDVPSPPAGDRVLKASTARRLTQMLEVTVREGTAAHAFRDGQGNRYLGRWGGVGKTGTLARRDPARTFSWYAGFAPAQNPQVAVAVMLANGDRWWRKANEVGRDVLRAYFAGKHVAGVTNPIRASRTRRPGKSRSR